MDPSGTYFITYLTRLRNYNYNSKLKYPKFINNQNRGKASITKMGFYTGSYNGCGWIATYNACSIMGLREHPSDIIYALETYGSIAFGTLGVSFNGIVKYFKKKYCRVKTYYPSKNCLKNFDSRIKTSDAAIVLYLNGLGAHYVAIDWTGNEFILYNHYSNINEPYKTSSARHEIFGKSPQLTYVVLICIS